MIVKLRTTIKRLLMKYGYPPDQQLGAIKLVMDQMEAMALRYACEWICLSRHRDVEVGEGERPVGEGLVSSLLARSSAAGS